MDAAVSGLDPATTPPPPTHIPHPKDRAKRANPSPKVTDLICRLPLPTLFHQLEATNLGDLLRLSVRPLIKTIASPRVSRTFLRAPDAAHGDTFAANKPLRQSNCFQGLSAIKKKRNLFPGRWPVYPGSLTLPSHPMTGGGILATFPFSTSPHRGSVYQRYPRD